MRNIPIFSPSLYRKTFPVSYYKPTQFRAIVVFLIVYRFNLKVGIELESYICKLKICFALCVNVSYSINVVYHQYCIEP